MLDRFRGKDGLSLLQEALQSQRVIGGDGPLADSIATLAEVQSFKPGSILIEDSAADNDILFILAGVVSIRVLGREIAVRSAGQQIGEMALVDPGQRRSASVVADSEVVVARLSESDFTRLADLYPRMWRNVARELAHRLRQRNKYVESVNPRPVLFVGCSAEAVPVARAIQVAFQYDPVVVKVWTDRVFSPSSFPVQALDQALVDVDFAVLVLSPDDEVVSRGAASPAPRDNVVFELGLFMGALGHTRTFLVHPRDVDVKVPTDLMGITPLTYESETGENLLAALAPTCDEMRAVILSVGPR